MMKRLRKGHSGPIFRSFSSQGTYPAPRTIETRAALCPILATIHIIRTGPVVAS